MRWENIRAETCAQCNSKFQRTVCFTENTTESCNSTKNTFQTVVGKRSP